MRFGPIPVGAAEGAILAHSMRAGRTMIRKGQRLTGEDIAALAGAGIGEVVAARLDPNDVHEDAAAVRLATAVGGAGIRVDPPFTGRANLFATEAGLFLADRGLVDHINRLDPALTLATLPNHAMVEPGRMVATVKVIPFAAPAAAVERAAAIAGPAAPLRIQPFRPMRVGLAATMLPSLKTSVMDKTRRILDERLAVGGSAIGEERRVAHETAALAEALRALAAAGHDLLIVFGASAVVDTRDVIPAAIAAAGGTVEHFGMPVDPGNLLVVGRLDGIPVLGAPGCARSPKENGFDWVLQRLMAGLQVSPDDITGMGVGGLLMEIVSRPQPRQPDPVGAMPPRVAALILAAGQSRRMGGPNKLLARIGGRSLVRTAAEAALASRAASVAVVTGHMADAVAAELDGLDVTLVHNPDYAEGLSTSLRRGLDSLPEDADAALILLADMPFVSAAMIDRLIAAFRPEEGTLVAVPTFEGKRGNPVLWSRRLFPALREVRGDTGGRHVLGANETALAEVELGRGVALDLDTPEALAAEGGVFA